MSLPLLEYDLLNEFPANASLMALEAFAFDGADYAGVQPSAWETTERSWDNGDPAYEPPQSLTQDATRGFGRWAGPGAAHIRPGELFVAPLDGSEVSSEFVGHDDVARVTPIGPSSLLRASWTRYNPGQAQGSGGTLTLVLQDAETGDVLDEQSLADGVLFADLPAITAHAVLWARYEGITRGWALPPDYLSVRGFSTVPDRFKYAEAGENYVWDYEADVGRRPSDLDHAFYALYEEAFLNGELVHRGEWTQYISTGGTEGGPWSALRIAVGEEDFVVGADFQPAPGVVLYELLTESTRAGVLVDPLALSISASTVLAHGDNAGQCRIAGTIATRSGPTTALWHFHPAAPADNLSATLLGTAEMLFVNMCEASLYPIVSDILEIPPQGEETVSRELVLTHSHLHEYTPDGATIPLRLPGLPLVTKGHPGGRCLRSPAKEIRFFTERFGEVAANNDRFAQFYNTLRTLDPRGTARTGRGTVFHGDNCAEACWNDYYGWVQDRGFGDPQARQYLAFMRDGEWDNVGLAGFPAASYRWQRLRSVSAAQRGVLVTCGKRADSEAAIWALTDGTTFTEAALSFRPRRLTRVIDESGTEWLYCVGRFVEESEAGWEIANGWSVIRLSGLFVTVRATWDPEVGDNGGFCMDRSDAEELGVDPEQLPPFLRWVPVAGMPAGGYWTPSETEPDEPFLELSVGLDSICYWLHGTLPYDPNLWPYIDFPVYDDGGFGDGPFAPVPGCTSAQCVVDQIGELDDPGEDDVVFIWDPGAGENGGYCTDRSDAEGAGLDPDELPPFLAWVPDLSAPAGGYWTPSETEPDEPYLELSLGVDSICYLLHGTLPYDPLQWPILVFPIQPGGGIGDGPFYPQPAGVQAIIEQKVVSAGPWASVQVCDVNDFYRGSGLRALRYQGQLMPNLWARVDRDEDQDDLSTYTIPLHWDQFISLPGEARAKFEVVALCFRGSGPLRGPVIMRRN